MPDLGPSASPRLARELVSRSSRLGEHARRLKRLLYWTVSLQLLARLKERRLVRLIYRSSLFDADYYRRRYPDVGANGMDPVLHYLRFGASEQRDPSASFSTATYRTRHPELPAKRNPLVDAILSGSAEDGAQFVAWPEPPEPASLSEIVFAGSAAPLLSVIVDVRADRAGTAAALAALARAQAAIELEVMLLVPPGSPLAITGARRITADPGVAGWNRAVGSALAPCVALLDAETRLAPDALPILLETLANTEAALVCGCRISRGGTLVDAGGSIAADGSLQWRGAGKPAGHYQFASLAPVEWCPPHLLVTTKEAWRETGGLDEAYASIVYAMADLSLRLRAKDRGVLCQPAARALSPPRSRTDAEHDNGADRRLLLQRRSGDIARARERARPRALFVDYQTPQPDRDSGSGDIYWFMRIFMRLGYEVTLLPALVLPPAGQYTDELRRLGIVCVSAPEVISPEGFIAGQAARFDIVLLYRAPLAARFIDLVRQKAPRAKVIFDTVDLHFVREEREALLQRSAAGAARARATKQMELSVIRKADCTIVLSDSERALLKSTVPGADIRLIPIVREIPGCEAPFEGRKDVLFLGGYAHQPNVDAITTFAAETWPAVRAKLPGARLIVAGSNPTPEVLRLDDSAAGVEVRGYVPDLHALMREVRLTVAPLRYGAGAKGKVVTSLAHGVPCVATPVAVEGMGLTPGVDVIVAEDPEAFAAGIAAVHEDPVIWERLSTNGVGFAERTFSVQRVTELIREMLQALSLPA